MELLGFCFHLTDGQGVLKLNSALIALCHLKFYLLHRFCLQVSGFRTFGSFFFFFSVLGEIKNIVILCDWEVFITTPCPEGWQLRKGIMCFLSLGQMGNNSKFAYVQILAAHK